MPAKIKCAPNGPLLVEGDEQIMTSAGTPLPHEGGTVALCRCGESSNKPFCDGSHSGAEFSDENQSDTSKNKKLTYEGKEVTVFYNKELCSHAARCVGNLPEVFNPAAKPWVQPDKAPADKLIETVKKCPSGALTFKVGDSEVKEWGWKNQKVSIAKDGPYYIEGSIELENAKIAEGATHEHFALCRCGKSGNKPFCNGNHRDIGFKAD